jgi:YD repeat-containing protein
LPGGILGSEIYRPGRVRDSFGETVDVHDGGGNVVQHVNQLGLASRMVFDNWNRNLRTISPEGNEERHSYDIRSNLTEKRIVAKPAAGSPDLVATTVYLGTPLTLPFQCADAKLCNKPSYEVDPMLARTDYSWSSTHGELLGVTMPADLHGAHPVSTYGYSSFTGTDGGSFYLITSKVDQIDATHTAPQTYGYDVGNKFVLKESTVTADSATLRTCYKFNAAGNLISKTDPSGTSGSCP